MNKVILIGRLGKDPELKYLNNGQSVCKFTMATSFKSKGEDNTTWHNITAWGKTAEICNQYLKKGKQVCIEGRINVSEYEKDGQKKYFYEVVATNVEFVGDAEKSKDTTPVSKRVNSGKAIEDDELEW